MSLAFLQTIFLRSILSFLNKKRMSFPSGQSKFRLLSLLVFVGVLVSQNSFSQDTIHRKKIGLVLSGGGAKGFAHIGVLKVLENAGVKIDYIGGTSMGADVGGLYASGYNATQIDSIFEYTNFNELLQDYIPRTSKSFYEKRNDEMYAISLPFSKLKIGIPIALSKGMYNYNLLAKLTHNVRNVRDFNKLPIPFVCIATDIEKGKQVILNKGYLAQAMMASSAFPSLFSPVEIDDKILIDGGVTNNYPVEELRKMGAEIIIGVDVQDDLKDRKALNDATRILVQITNLDMINKMQGKVKLTDVYIKPDVSEYGVISFNDGKEIIKKGEEAALLKIGEIQKFCNLQTAVQRQAVKDEVYKIDLKKIDITELKNYTRAYVLGKLRIKAGKKTTYDELKSGINTLNATQNFSRISYSIDSYQDGDALHLNLVENDTKTFLKFGLHYDDLYKSALLVNVTQKKILFKNDVLSLDMALGDNIRYNFDYYIDNGFYWSFGIKSWYSTFNRNVATDFRNGEVLSQLGVDKLNIDFSDFTNQAYMQTVFIQKYLIGAGIEYKHLKIQTSTIENGDSVFEDSNYFNLFGHLKYDSFDNKYFPKSGWLFYGDFKTYLYSSNYTNEFNQFSVAKGEISFAQTILKKFTIKVQSEAGFKIGNDSVDFFNFVLGGYGYNTINNFKHFYGYDYLSVSANSFIKSNFTLDYEIFKKNHLNFSANYANLEDGLFASGNWFSKPKLSGYAFGYGIESIVGPIEVKYSWSPELPKGYVWVSAGFWF